MVGRDSFQSILSAAIADIVERGFDSQERIDRWMRELRIAAERMTTSAASLEDMLRGSLAAIYRRLIDRGGVLRYVPGIDRYTIERVQPLLRSELDRRIAASANLIKLNRAEVIEQTLRRFQGWSTSIPPGGVAPRGRREAKKEIKRSLASLPFIERRVLIDQGHKLTAALSDVVATGGGAIAGLWRSNWRQAGYDYREDHKDRDGEVYLIRDSWAHKAGLVKPRKNGFTDYITQPAQEVSCRCYYRYLFNLRDLPADMLSAKGRAALAKARAGGVAGSPGSRTDAAQITELSRSVVWDAYQLDRLGWMNGVADIKVSDDHSEWHAQYDDGPDSITLYPKFFDLSPWEQLHTLVHEVGHRGQIVGRRVYDAFLEAHVHQLEDFLHIANKVHIEDFEREGIDRNVLADEVFAESYARACIGLAMPDELIEFWNNQLSLAGIASKASVSYTDTWPNRVTRCQRCSTFMRISAALADNACSAVGGRISAHGHCSLFGAIGARAA
jgi:hypothetical protein